MTSDVEEKDRIWRLECNMAIEVSWSFGEFVEGWWKRRKGVRELLVGVGRRP